MALKYTLPSEGFQNLINNKTIFSKQVQSVAEHAPHKVYTILPEDIENGDDLANAKQVGWRVFHLDDHETVIEGYCNENDESHEFGGFNQGPFVQGTRDVISLAEKLEETANDDFEVAMIRLPWIYVMALWLKHADPFNDIIIPFGPLHSEFTAGQRYTQQQFVATLKDAIASDKEFDRNEETN